MNLSLTSALAELPQIWPEEILPVIRARVAASNRVIVVLDDDPTGTQTVYDTPVLTVWDEDSLAREFDRGHQLFYILTNSRSLPPDSAAQLAREIGENLTFAAKRTGRTFTVISRSDSTLRGHYPLEVDALQEACGEKDAVHVLCPFFEEGGRYTIGDIHYVAEGDNLVPAAETPFARDPSFGYTQSNLREWVAEKSQGTIPVERVDFLSLHILRQGGPSAAARQLAAAEPGSAIVINAADFRDVEVAVLGLLEAEANGGKFICRTAASFVRARAGLEKRPLLSATELTSGTNAGARPGGLVVVGSYVPKTTQQLEVLVKNGRVFPVELPVRQLLDRGSNGAAITSALAETERLLADGKNVVLYTSRELITGSDAVQSLTIGANVSSALVQVVRELKTTPSFLIAKGGITSSDIATKGLKVRRAMVRGQLLPGIPVWKLGPESRFPGLNYIVFPGNVGGTGALLEAVQKLSDAGWKGCA